MRKGSITNALIRCTREDKTPLKSFDLVRADLGLWVRELDYDASMEIPAQIISILEQLQALEPELRSLSDCTTNYALFIEFDLPVPIPVMIPVALSRLASTCNFDIELYINQKQEGEAEEAV